MTTRELIVDGQNGCVPRSELIRESAPNDTQNLPDPNQSAQRSESPLKTLMQEFVVPLSNGRKAVFQWPTSLSMEDVEDLEDALKMLDRKITRSTALTSETKAD